MRRKGFLALLCGYGLLRVGELVLSARHEKALSREGVPRATERNFHVMVAAHVTPFLLIPVEQRWRERRGMKTHNGIAIGAGVALAAAFALRLWTIRTLSGNWNVRIHAGPQMKVITTGPYRHIRHPNYAAVLLELLALPLAGNAPLTALAATAFNALALASRIRDEERALSTNVEWKTCMSRKPRFVPNPFGSLARARRRSIQSN